MSFCSWQDRVLPESSVSAPCTIGIIDFNNNNQVTICPNGSCGANGGNYGFNRTYSGYEFIYFGFTLPADAINVALKLDSAVFDDRAVVDLNAHVLGTWGINGLSYAPGTSCNSTTALALTM